MVFRFISNPMGGRVHKERQGTQRERVLKEREGTQRERGYTKRARVFVYTSIVCFIFTRYNLVSKSPSLLACVSPWNLINFMGVTLVKWAYMVDCLWKVTPQNLWLFNIHMWSLELAMAWALMSVVSWFVMGVRGPWPDEYHIMTINPSTTVCQVSESLLYLVVQDN